MRRTHEREDQVEPECGTFDNKPAEWSGSALSPPAGPRDCMLRREWAPEAAMRACGLSGPAAAKNKGGPTLAFKRTGKYR
jgi:hypothetical protein